MPPKPPTTTGRAHFGSRAPAMPLPPRAEMRPVTITLHEETRVDPYAWLRDDNWQQVMHQPDVLRADIRAYLEAENAYCSAVLSDTDAVQAALIEEMKGRIKREDSSVPSRDGPFAYYQRYEATSQHPIHCRVPAHGQGPETVMLDVNAAAEGKAFYRVPAAEHSPDHTLLAFAADETGSELHAITVRTIADGTEVDSAVRDATGDVVWANDSRTFFYTVLDDNHRPSKVFRHRVGTAQSDDVLVYEELDPGFFVGIGKTESGRYLLINAHDHVTSEIQFIEADHPDEAPRMLAKREPGIEYHAAHHGDRFLITTNADGAEDFKIVTVPVATPGREHWRNLVPHQAGRLLLSLRVTAKFMARLERVDGLPRIVVRRFADGEEHVISFPEEAYDLSIVPGYEFATTELRFAYSSFTTPREIYDYDMAKRSRTLRKRQEIPSGHDPAEYVTRRLMAKSHDGELVPVSILHRRDTKLDGTAPLMLYGYGAYGMAMPAMFNPNRFTLVDRGFVYAIAHIRGGTDRGYRWYREGRTTTKANTFLDFIAAAEHLIASGYTWQGGIAAHGGSAGGLLVGAVVNMRPDLFKAAVGEVPFVDVLNTICDPTLPLTPPEWPEWGNPIEDPKAFRTIRGYSPYDNVAAQDYPSILATAGLADPRVTYWEPAKWVAKLRATKTDQNLLLLKTNMAAGHAGASGRFAKLEEIAMIYAFLLKVFDRLDRVTVEPGQAQNAA